MKALKLFGLLLLISISSFSQTQRFLVINWDTITIRTTDKVTKNMITNFNYLASTLPTGLEPTLELFAYKGEIENAASDLLYYKESSYTFFDTLDNTFGTRTCKLQTIPTYRDSTDLFESIDYVKAQHNQEIFELQKQIEFLLFFCAYNYKVAHSQPIPSKLENVLLPKFLQVAEDWYINYINAEGKKDAVRNEEAIDIESGWVE